MKKKKKEKRKKRRCDECGGWFEPSLRKGGVQRTCLKTDCQKARHRKNCATWHEKNKGKGNWVGVKRRSWAKKKKYWINHRKDDPTYRKREAARMKTKRKKAKNVANRDSVSQIFLGKLESIPTSSLNALENVASVAIRDSVPPVFRRDPRVDQLIFCLKWRESVAN